MISFSSVLVIFISLYLHVHTFASPPLSQTQKTFSLEEHVELNPFLNTSFEQANLAIGCQPLIIDASQQMINEIFLIFNRGPNLAKICEVTKRWADSFITRKGGPWENTNYRFGIFDKCKPTHKKNRLIQGVNCKISREYYDWIRNNHGEELAAIPDLEFLFDKLMEIEEVCHSALIREAKKIAQSYPNITKIFYSYKGKERIPLSIRVTRYDNNGNFCLPLHHDISVLSLIFQSDDDPHKECLIVASPKDFSLGNLKRPIRATPISPTQVSGILVAGALMPFLDIPIQPSPHAVLPHDRDARYVIVICCHVPNMCTSNLNAILNDMNDLPEKFKQKWGL